MFASGGGVLSKPGEKGGDEDDAVFRLCPVWAYMGGLAPHRPHRNKWVARFRKKRVVRLWEKWMVRSGRRMDGICEGYLRYIP